MLKSHFPCKHYWQIQFSILIHGFKCKLDFSPFADLVRALFMIPGRQEMMPGTKHPSWHSPVRTCWPAIHTILVQLKGHKAFPAANVGFNNDFYNNILPTLLYPTFTSHVSIMMARCWTWSGSLNMTIWLAVTYISDKNFTVCHLLPIIYQRVKHL